jgi:alpha-tubulin suppressor-like RCC1 family protein
MDNSGLPHSIQRILRPLMVAVLCMALMLPSALPVMAADVATTTLIASNPNPSVFGQTVNLTAIVTATTGTPAGTVTFKNGSTAIGSMALTSGSALYPVSTLITGTHTITADFDGNTGFADSTSLNSISQVVNKAGTTITLASSKNPSSLNESVTFTATVAAVSPGSGTPAGQVTFKNGETIMGTGTLSAGVATYQTDTLAAGAHTITALYPGNDNFLNSTSGVLTQTVQENTAGYVWDWGDDAKYQLGDNSTTAKDVPQLLSYISTKEFKSIAGGLNHSLAVDSDGRVRVWGTNDKGQLAISTSTTKKTTPFELTESTLSSIEEVAAGESHCLALDKNGYVWAWGYNKYGQTGNGTASSTNVITPVKVLKGAQENPDSGETYLSGIIAIAAGQYHSLALDKDGYVYSWGYNKYGQIGDGTSSSSVYATTPVKVLRGEQAGTTYLSNIKYVATGYGHNLAVDGTGLVYAWGYNNYGQIGNNTSSSTTYATTPKKSSISSVKEVAAGQYHSLALKTDGTVWAWGYDKYGQLGIGSTSNKTAPVAVVVTNMAHKITAISAGYNHSLALDQDGIVWGWGDNAKGQVGDGKDETYQDEPVTLTSPNGVVSVIAAGANHNLAISSSNSTLKITTTSLANATVNKTYDAVKITASGGTKPYTFEIWPDYDGDAVNAVLDITQPTSSSVYCTLKGTFTTATTYKFIIQVTDDKDSMDMQYLTIKVTSSGTGEPGYVWDWGYNKYGQLGDGSTTDVDSPQGLNADDIDDFPSDFENIISMAGGESYSLALDEAGNVWAWGYNGKGQLGNGSSSTSAYTKVPEQIEEDVDGNSFGDIEKIAAGSSHGLALDGDGNVWAWGYNKDGQLGDASKVDEHAPVKLDLDNIKEIAAGYYHSLALDADGNVWAWGDNSKGQLGDDSQTDRTEPVQVNGLTGVKYIAAGAYHSLAVDSNGQVWAWGDNSHGQLGINENPDDTDLVTEPEEVYSTTMKDTIIGIAAGQYHSLALDENNYVWAWGEDSDGQLGIGSTTDKYAPNKVKTGEQDDSS